MISSLIMFLGGIALFVYGITNFSDQLKFVSSKKFQDLIVKVINNPFTGVIIGILITMVTSSSSVVLILVISLVRAGFITARQSVGLIIGANVGSTISAFIVSIPVGNLSYAILIVGILLMFFKKSSIKNIGKIVLNLGLLFLGLNIMEDGIRPLIQTGFAENLFLLFSEVSFVGTSLGFLFGTVSTAIVQSSSAVIAIIQKLYSLNDPVNSIYTISLRGALPIIIGANIGTTITGFIASIGGNTESKRTAIIHLLFNVVGAVIFLSLMHPFYLGIQAIENAFLPQYSMVTMAIAHLIQNTVTAIVVFLLINQIVKLSERLVPIKESEMNGLVFDERIIRQSPITAIDLSKKEILHLCNFTCDYFELTKKYSFEDNKDIINQANEHERAIDELSAQIRDYLIKVNASKRINAEVMDITKLLDINRELERIADMFSNIIEMFNSRYHAGQTLSPVAEKEITDLYDTLEEMFLLIKQSIQSNYKFIPHKVMDLEDVVDLLENNARLNYVERLKGGECNLYETSYYSDILYSLERLGDHLTNIASVIIGENYIKVTGLKNVY